MFVIYAYSYFKQSRCLIENKPKKKKKWEKLVKERNKVSKSKMKPGI